MVVALVIALIGIALFAVSRGLGDDDEPRATPATPTTATAAEPTPKGRGSDPWPVVPRIIAGGIELVDLRRLPFDAQRVARLASVSEQLRAASPYVARCLLVDPKAFEVWLQLDPVALLIVAGNLNEAARAMKCFVHAPGFRALTDDEQAHCKAAGLEYATELSIVGPDGSLDLFAEVPPCEPWRKESDSRPVPQSYCYGDALGSTNVVSLVPPMAFIDLRRLSAKRRLHPTCFDELTRVIAQAAARPEWKPTEVVWILAPWILDEWRDRAAAAELLACAEPLRRFGPQRIALTDVAPEQSDEMKRHSFMRTLIESGFTGVVNRFQWKTLEGNVFVVDALTALEDSYGLQAWRPIEEQIGKKSPS